MSIGAEHFPRSMMIHNRQRIIYSSEEAMEIFNEGNGKSSVFISSNSYPEIPENPETKKPSIAMVQNVKVIQMYIDLDADKLENALGDCRKLVDWATKENLPFHVAFSGRKGFQFCILFDPATYDIEEEIRIDTETIVQWRAYYTATYTFLKNALGLRTIDFQCAEPKRIMRVWNSKHFKRGAKEPSGLYCVPLRPEHIQTWSIDQILEYAKAPRFPKIDWNIQSKRLRFHDFILEYQISPTILSIRNATFQNGVLLQRFIPGEGIDYNRMKALISPNGDNLCVLNQMWNTRNPVHLARFDSACRWKKMSVDQRSSFFVDPEWVDEFYVQMQYDDVGERDERLRQIRSIWNRGPGSLRPWLPLYEPPSCAKKYAVGICAGPDCPKFERYLVNIGRDLGDLIKDEEGNWIPSIEATQTV